MNDFVYEQAFSRNLGLLTEDEQNLLKTKRIAIAGLGGAGGQNLLTLTRLGITKFNLAEFDKFEQHNFNRQAGAFMSTIDVPKIDAITKMAKDINPQLDLRIYPYGVRDHNIDAFLADVDIYVDGLDYFAFDMRQAVFEACYKKGIPVVSVAPLGMSAALLVFMPGGMTFEEYFGFKDQDDFSKAVRMLVGYAPSALHVTSVVDGSRINFAKKSGPSTSMAVEICAGIAGTEVLKILLGRGKVLAVPRSMQFDAYTNRLVHSNVPMGYRNPLQRIKIWCVSQMLSKN